MRKGSIKTLSILFKFTLVADKFLSFSVHLIKYNEGIYFHSQATELILAIEMWKDRTINFASIKKPLRSNNQMS